MLKTVHFQSIKALQDVRLDLAPLTFLVGPNGCGKSTLLDQIEVLCGCSHHDPGSRHALGRAGEVLSAVDPPSLRTEGDSDGSMSWQGQDSSGATFSIECPAGPAKGWYDRVKLVASADGRALVMDVNELRQEKRAEFDDLLSSHLSWWSQRLRLIPQYIAAPVDVREERLDPSGYGLASILTAFALNDQQAYAALQADMAAIVPEFQRIHISKVEIEGKDKVKHGGVSLGMVFRGAGRRPASQISDGTLLALALLTATHNREMPPLVLMDDIDHGLHLGAQMTLIRAIRKVMEVRPDLQVVCTTHSPYLLDAAKPDEVRVMALDANGHTVVRPLTAYPDFERHHRGLQTGEFWATFGEGWVADTGGAA